MDELVKDICLRSSTSPTTSVCGPEGTAKPPLSYILVAPTNLTTVVDNPS